MQALDTYAYGDDLAMLTDGRGGVLFYDARAAVDLGEWR